MDTLLQPSNNHSSMKVGVSAFVTYCCITTHQLFKKHTVITPQFLQVWDSGGLRCVPGSGALKAQREEDHFQAHSQGWWQDAAPEGLLD